jgi:hypothetical protein
MMNQFMLQNRWCVLVVLTIAVLALLTACNSSSATDLLALGPVQEQPTSPAELNIAQDENPPEILTTEIRPTATALPTQEDPEPTDSQVVKTELEATDPGTVQMASGKPQLVEFFAFW